MFPLRAGRYLIVSLLLLFPWRDTWAQATVSGFAGFEWGSTREAVLARFGKPREDLQQDSIERISYIQGPDSGYLFGFSRGHGLVAGIRIVPLPTGDQCSAVVGAAKQHLAREFGTLTPLETKRAASSGVSCGGYGEWDVLWRDSARNRVLLSIDVVRHRLYINYSSRLSPF